MLKATVCDCPHQLRSEQEVFEAGRVNTCKLQMIPKIKAEKHKFSLEYNYFVNYEFLSLFYLPLIISETSG